MSSPPEIGARLIHWGQNEKSVKGLVLFGSRARPPEAAASADGWSDIDLYLITSTPRRFEDRAWTTALRGLKICLYVVRPASGGVRKITLVCPTGEADIVIVPVRLMRRLRSAARLGLYRRRPPLRQVLNEFSTIMRGGYRFLKGERQWGAFYAWAVERMPGQRLGAAETAKIADVFLCDLLSVLQRIQRGELVTAQRNLHRLLAETNFQLMHEARLRRNAISYREARRVERLLSAEELSLLQVSAPLDAAALIRSTRKIYRSFRKLMAELNSDWSVPAAFGQLLISYLGR